MQSKAVKARRRLRRCRRSGDAATWWSSVCRFALYQASYDSPNDIMLTAYMGERNSALRKEWDRLRANNAVPLFFVWTYRQLAATFCATKTTDQVTRLVLQVFKGMTYSEAIRSWQEFVSWAGMFYHIPSAHARVKKHSVLVESALLRIIQ